MVSASNLTLGVGAFSKVALPFLWKVCFKSWQLYQQYAWASAQQFRVSCVRACDNGLQGGECGRLDRQLLYHSTKGPYKDIYISITSWYFHESY